MMSKGTELPVWIRSKKHGGSVQKIYYVFMKELGLSYKDIQEMPIPAIIALSQEMYEEQKRSVKRNTNNR